MDIDLFYTESCAGFREAVARRLEHAFGLTVRDAGALPACGHAWNSRRSQCDAHALLDHVVRHMRSRAALWMVDRDIFCEGVNFVFGLAMFHTAAVVSTFRLRSGAMVVKEAVHEVGHVMGLPHCPNRCVMRFSNSYEDALQKPDTLCGSCQGALDRKVVEPGLRT